MNARISHVYDCGQVTLSALVSSSLAHGSQQCPLTGLLWGLNRMMHLMGAWSLPELSRQQLSILLLLLF